MRVAVVCPYSLTVPGGVQGQVLGLARALRRHGHVVRVLAPCDGAPPDAGVTPLGRSIPTATNGSVAPIAPDPSAALRTMRALRDEDFDVVHLHEPLVPGPAVTSLFLKSHPLVGTFHRSGSSAAYSAAKPIARWLARRLTLRFAVSEDARRTAQAALGGEYEVLFNGIEVDRYAVGPTAERSGPTVLFCGRHEPRKGLAVLLEALQHLPADVTVWVASDGPQTAELRARFPDERVVWLGRIDDGEKAARLRAADVFCAPSLGGESFGVVLLEGMAAGTAVVASDLPGYRNVARPDVDSLLTPPGDAAALGEAICRVLGDADTAARLVTAGRARAAAFSMDRLAELYVDRYATAASTGPRARRRPGT